MSLLPDSTTVRPKCRFDEAGLPKRPNLKVQCEQKPVHLSSVSSIVKTSLSWAGDAILSYWDGSTKEERRKKMDFEDRKRILYLRMRNVSATLNFD